MREDRKGQSSQLKLSQLKDENPSVKKGNYVSGYSSFAALFSLSRIIVFSGFNSRALA